LFFSPQPETAAAKARISKNDATDFIMPPIEKDTQTYHFNLKL
jgi:hypothetical protein